MLNVISREATPNPNAFKYHTGARLVNGQLSFGSDQEAQGLPIAKELFDLGSVTSVLVAEDFVSVSAIPEADWDEIEGVITRELSSYSVADANRLAEERAAAAHIKKSAANESELYKRVEEVLEKWVRPALAADGGGIELLGIEEKEVVIRYQGACGSCPTSTRNTLFAIENLLRDQVDPEISVTPG